MPNLDSFLTRTVIESPCASSDRGTFDQHREYLGRAIIDSINHNEAPIASHGLLAFSGLLDDNNPAERATGTAAGWAWVPVAERLACYIDYGISPGMQTAISLAALHGIPVAYRTIGTNEAPTQ